MEIKVEHIKDIAEHEVMMLPGVIVNGKVKAAGRVPGKEEIKERIEEEK
ncbi:MAG: thioredoxin family protein [Desulfotomaculum sp.]|nr:thioredoxin family protein [Desulfotomaculum sp.]